MSTESKPREYWIVKGQVKDAMWGSFRTKSMAESSSRMFNNAEIIPVIEYSAYEAVTKERDAALRALDMESQEPVDRSQEAAHYNYLDEKIQQLEKENAELKEKLALKLTTLDLTVFKLKDLEEKLGVAESAIREEYEDYYRHIDKHDIPVTKEYTRCVANLSKALQNLKGDEA